jgi:hypothetical protein
MTHGWIASLLEPATGLAEGETRWLLAMTEKISLSAISRQQLICPSCQSVAVGAIDRSPKSHAYPRLSCARKRGAARDRHERWARDAVDVRQRFRRARSLADGEDVWS